MTSTTAPHSPPERPLSSASVAKFDRCVYATTPLNCGNFSRVGVPPVGGLLVLFAGVLQEAAGEDVGDGRPAGVAGRSLVGVLLRRQLLNELGLGEFLTVFVVGSFDELDLLVGAALLDRSAPPACLLAKPDLPHGRTPLGWNRGGPARVCQQEPLSMSVERGFFFLCTVLVHPSS
jgi:hypothetical protein